MAVRLVTFRANRYFMRARFGFMISVIIRNTVLIFNKSTVLILCCRLNRPKPQEKEDMAMSIITVFPCLKDNSSTGYVSFPFTYTVLSTYELLLGQLLLVQAVNPDYDGSVMTAISHYL